VKQTGVETPLLANKTLLLANKKNRHPSIQEVDFFEFEPLKPYDVVVLAMVLNCVENAEQRGEMLLKIRKLTNPDGLLFLVLPSRYGNLE
jgi:2-polyprenyl-3-methyl-5-hydroxy-6-metoxy-1,4-benzoquinol methylase